MMCNNMLKLIKLAAPVLTAALLWGCAPAEAPAEPAGTRPPVTSVPPETESVPETAPYYAIPVDTPCGILYLPDSWDTPIQTEAILGEPMVISFWAEDVKLYELTFSEVPGEAVGMAQTEDGPVYVGMRLAALEEHDQLLAMQESVNELLMQLRLEELPVTPVTTEPGEDIRIETPYGSLYFPGKWEDCLLTEQDDSLVDFYAALPDREPVLLFTVVFDTANGHLSGVITAADGTERDFAIVSHRPELTGDWTDGEKDTIFAMQEDMNALLDGCER